MDSIVTPEPGRRVNPKPDWYKPLLFVRYRVSKRKLLYLLANLQPDGVHSYHGKNAADHRNGCTTIQVHSAVLPNPMDPNLSEAMGLEVDAWAAAQRCPGL
jgi:hypothetical protein